MYASGPGRYVTTCITNCAPFTLKSAPAQTLNHRVAVPSAHMGRPLGRVSISAATYTPGAWKEGRV